MAPHPVLPLPLSRQIPHGGRCLFSPLTKRCRWGVHYSPLIRGAGGVFRPRRWKLGFYYTPLSRSTERSRRSPLFLEGKFHWANAIRPYTPNCQLSTENSHPPVCSPATHTQSLLLLSQTPSRRMSSHKTLPARPPVRCWL